MTPSIRSSSKIPSSTQEQHEIVKTAEDRRAMTSSSSSRVLWCSSEFFIRYSEERAANRCLRLFCLFAFGHAAFGNLPINDVLAPTSPRTTTVSGSNRVDIDPVSFPTASLN
uniref:Uncharacterized protein n=1 Tax=Grammatophora oceanica TaxID=210454 RepID=A0A7S1VEN2_9STRA